MNTCVRLALALVQLMLLAMAVPQPVLAQAAPQPLMTAGELHRRIFIMGYYLNQASSALAAGDQDAAVAQFDRFQKAYDEIDDEVLLPLYPTHYHLLDELTEGLETVFLFNRSQGIDNAEPLLAAMREQLLDVARDLEARISADGPERPLPLPDLVTAGGS
jgi:hypothetical protein